MQKTSKASYVEKIFEGVDWAGLGIHLAIIHGSFLRDERPRDVDMILVIDKTYDEDETVIKIMRIVEERTGLEADIYIIQDPAEANCFLIWEALRNGIILYQDPVGREVLVKTINICYDFMLSREKLRYTETMIERYDKNVA